MTEKQKLTLHFAWDCFFITSSCMAMMMYSRLFFVLIGLNALFGIFLNKGKPKTKKNERELNSLEVVVWFTIGFSALWILFVAVFRGFLFKPAVIIPICIIGLAARLLWFAKDWAALKNPFAAK